MLIIFNVIIYLNNILNENILWVFFLPLFETVSFIPFTNESNKTDLSFILIVVTFAECILNYFRRLLFFVFS